MSGRLIGNASVVTSLEGLARSPNLGHAYLLSGPEGVGKRLAALAFARAVNCRCTNGSEICDSCRLMATMNHPELLIFEDANKPRWFERARLAAELGGGKGEDRKVYHDSIEAVIDAGWLDEPLPRVDKDAVFDAFTIMTDQLFGRGSVPSKECYTPQPVSETIRKQYDGGDLSAAEFLLLRRLYEYPLSILPYRGSIPIAYMAQRRGWNFVRPVQAFLSMKTMLGGKKIVVIDDAHKMTPEAQNCLLKTLEEPPPDSVLVLVTSDRRALFETIVSRCQVVGFSRLSAAEIDLAAGALLGDRGPRTRLVESMSEGCPGRLLELAMVDVDRRLEQVRDLLQGLANGRLESVFRFTGAIMETGSTHRRKMREHVGRTLELLVFWLVEIMRAGQGLPDRIGIDDFTAALRAQAQVLDEKSLLAAAHHLERSFRLLHLNVDLNLFLTATLLRLGKTLGKTPGSGLAI